jgi:hypothetical protein
MTYHPTPPAMRKSRNPPDFLKPSDKSPAISPEKIPAVIDEKHENADTAENMRKPGTVCVRRRCPDFLSLTSLSVRVAW